MRHRAMISVAVVPVPGWGRARATCVASLLTIQADNLDRSRITLARSVPRAAIADTRGRELMIESSQVPTAGHLIEGVCRLFARCSPRSRFADPAWLGSMARWNTR